VAYCLNCGAPLIGKYCHVCGQKAHVNRLTAKALMEEVVHFFTHAEETFFKTTLHYIIKPGITSLNYIEGKRKRYQKPVSYFLIWTGVYILLHNFILNQFHYELVLQKTEQTLVQEEANRFFRNHFSFFILPIMILSAFIIWLVLGRPCFYYFELLTIVLYGGGTYFALCAISDILLGIIFRININHYTVFFWQMILSGLYNIWFTFDFFRHIKISGFWPRLILVAILISLSGNFIMLYLPMAWLSLTK
jgi:Protein of unknown function (DUF3667)